MQQIGSTTETQKPAQINTGIKIEEKKPSPKAQPEASVPITSPPLLSSEIKQISAEEAVLITNYIQAREKILGAPLMKKLEEAWFGLSNEKQTKEEKAKINEFGNCKERQALIDKVHQLFFTAYSLDPITGELSISKSAKEKLFSFLAQLETHLIDDQGIILYFRLSHKDLHPDDLNLILQFMSSKKENKKHLESQLIKRVISLTKEDLKTYDGERSRTESKINKRIDAFWWALDMVLDGGRNIDQLIASNLFKVYGKYLDKTGKKLYRTARKGSKEAKEDLLNYFQFIGQELYMASWGSSEKINLYRTSMALYQAALATGITDEEINARVLISALPPSKVLEGKELIEDFHKWMMIFSAAKDSPEKMDNLKAKPYFLQKVEDLIGRYLEAKTWKERSTLQIMICAYFSFVQDLGISLEQTKSLIESLRPAKREKPVVLEEIKQEGYISIRPEDLPTEVVKILKELGAWEGFRQATIRINLVHDINPSKYSENTINPAGHLSIPGEITIDTRDENTGEMMSPEILAIFLIHEGAGHAKWFFKHYHNPDLLKSLPNERNAYLLENYAEQRLIFELIKKKKMDQKTLSMIVSLLYQSHNLVRNANKVLGYPENDFSFRTDIPALENKPDLDIYPTQITKNKMVSWDEIGVLLKKIGYTKLDIKEAEKYFRPILEDGYKLYGELHLPVDEQGNYKLDENGSPIILSSHTILKNKKNKSLFRLDKAPNIIIHVLQAMAIKAGTQLELNGLADKKTSQTLANIFYGANRKPIFMTSSDKRERQEIIKVITQNGKFTVRWKLGAHELDYLLQNVFQQERTKAIIQELHQIDHYLDKLKASLKKFYDYPYNKPLRKTLNGISEKTVLF